MKHSLFLIALGLFTLTLPARADTPRALPTDATLSRLIQESLAARPELAQSAAIVHAETERTAQAEAMPDPMLQIGIQNDGFTSIEIGRMDTSYVSFMASQTVPWPGKRGLKRQVAEVGVAQAKQALARARISSEADVRRAYWDLVLVRDRLTLLEQLEAVWQKSSGTARTRYETAGGAQSDLLRAQLELSRLSQRRYGLQAEERARVQELNRLRVRPLEQPIVTVTHIRELPPLDGFDGWFSAERTLRQSPELSTARLSVTRAQKGSALAERGYYPDLTVGAGIMVRGALPPMWLVTVAGPLPIFASSKQARAVAENRAWADASQQEVATLEQLLRWRTAERSSAFFALRQMIELYQRSLLVQSQATAESTLAQYKVGKLTFAAVLEANAGFIADQEAYLQALVAAYRILIAQAELSLAATPVPIGAGAANGMPGAGAMPTSSGSSSAPASAAPQAARSSSGM